MTTEAGGLEQRHRQLVVEGLGGLITAHTLEAIAPRMRPLTVILHPTTAIVIDKVIATTVECIEVVVTLSRLYHRGIDLTLLGSHISVIIMILIHVITIGRLIPYRHQSLIVERTHLVNQSQSLIGLTTTGIVVCREDPLELSAYTVTHRLCQNNLLLHQVAELLLGITFG